MLTEKEIAYYNRQLNLAEFGLEAQEKLKRAHVLVIGVGGLGCPALQYLAGAGVGNLGLLDGDVVSESNIHRQLLFDINSLGLKKVDVAKEKLEAINPYISVKTFNCFLTLENAYEVISNYDIIVDCTDTLSIRYLINDVCVLQDKPLIYGAMYRFEGQVSVFNYNNGPTYRCVFPAINENKNATNCNEAGVLGVLPGIVGIFQATEVIKLICNIGELLSGKLLIYSALNFKTSLLKINRIEIDYKSDLNLNGIKLEQESCDLNIKYNDFQMSQFNKNEDFIILDVRNFDEFPRIESENLIEIPLADLEKNKHKIPLNTKIICICKSGKRSLSAIEILQNQTESRFLFNLKNGITNEFIDMMKNLNQELNCKNI